MLDLKKSFVRGAAFGAGLLSMIALSVVVAVSVSGVVHTFTAGQPVSASEMNENFASLKSAIETLPLGTYCGSTGAVTGAMGGFTGARALCQAVSACGTRGHMCTAHELSMSRTQGIVVPAVNAWYTTYTYKNGTATQDCDSWTNAAGGIMGPVISAAQSGPSEAACNSSLPIVCCN